jgi:hypothetical protein
MELLTGICIESTVVVQNIDKVKLVPYSNFVIIWIVSRSDLHGTSSKRHVNSDGIRHYRKTAVYERMNGKLVMKVLHRGDYINSGFWPEKRYSSLYSVHHWDAQRWLYPQAWSLDAWSPL